MPGSRIVLVGDIAQVELRRRGKPSLWAQVDVSDVPLIKPYSWWPHFTYGTTYARTEIWREGKRIAPYMHVVLMGVAGIDHINGEGTDNRRANLRPADKAQNGRNSRSRRGSTSSYKGVCWYKIGRNWRAQIKPGNGVETTHIGYFDSELEAARAYDQEARRRFGEFARTNFPDGS